jgi:hypothetical protein
MSDPILDAITYQDFKNFFYRDGFNFIPYDEWSELITYNINNSVYFRDTKKIYTSLINNNLNWIPNISPTQWRQETTDVFQYVLPEDVERAFTDAICYGRFMPITDEDCRIKAYLYLTAHFTAKRINEQYNKSFTPNLSSMSVGGVSESYVIPEWLNTKDNMLFTSTMFGIQYKLLLERYTGFTFTHLIGDVNVL